MPRTDCYSQCSGWQSVRAVALALLLLPFVGVVPLFARQSSNKPAAPRTERASARIDTADGAAIVVEAQWNASTYLSSNARLEFRLSRALATRYERLGLVVGALDVSALLKVDDRSAWFTPERMRLPAGETEAVAFIVDSAGTWRELARFPLRIRSRVGLDEATVRPSVELSTSGPFARGDPPDVGPIERRTYQDVTLRLGVQNTMAHQDWRVTSQANALGASEATQRLRFGEQQSDAPALDLADYQVLGERTGFGFAVGHQSVGQHRLLTNGFSSRGLGATFRFGPAVSLETAVLNGTSVTGWANPIGISEPRHRVLTAGLSLELIPSRPGALQVHVSGIDGSLLPQTSFNQSAVTDAERNRGGAARVILSDIDQRVRVEAGIARASFTNPTDPLLNGGNDDVVAVRSETRVARYGEFTADLLRNVAVTDRVTATLSTVARHERADPLYRSIGAFVQPDRDANSVELIGTLGLLSLKSTFGSSRDNLQHIASILTSRTRGRTFAAALPLGSLCAGTVCAWPSISYANDRSHQFGEGVPVDGAFEASHVPDQQSVNQTALFNWSLRGLAAEYRWNESQQDNRQPGRELADFRSTVHAVTVSGVAFADADASFDVSRELQTNAEIDATQRLDRIGSTVRWKVASTTDVLAVLSHAWGSQPANGQRTRNMEYQFEISRGVNLYRRFDGGTQGRLWVRFARTRAAVLPALPQPLLNARITWTLNAGGSIRLF